MSEQTYPVSTIAKLLILTERQVQSLAKQGVLPKTERARYELVPVVQAYIRYLRERAMGGAVGGTEDDRIRLHPIVNRLRRNAQPPCSRGQRLTASHQTNSLLLELQRVARPHHSRHIRSSKTDDTHSALRDVLRGQGHDTHDCWFADEQEIDMSWID